MFIDVKPINGGKIPTKGTELSAGFDLYANIGFNGERVVIFPGKTAIIGTGVAIQPPPNVAGLLLGRSSFNRDGLMLSVSLIDPDYTGEIMCHFRNVTDGAQFIYHGDRIAQIMFVEVPDVRFVQVEELHETERGDGGFGSTGKR